MASVNHPPPAVKPAEALTEEFRRQGYLPGAPAHVEAFGQTVDLGVCLELQCAACDNRGLEYRPFRRGRKYRVLVVCMRCSFAEEF